MIRPLLACTVCMMVLFIYSQESAAAVTPPPGAYSRLINGSSVELIVEYDDTEIENNAAKMRHRLARRQDDSSIKAYKVKAYSVLKNRVDGASRPDIHELATYSHLPMSFKRFDSVGALNAFLAQTGVKAVYANEKMHRVLAQSLPLINQPSVSAVGEQGTGTTVAVIDDGIDYTNPAFGPCTSPGVPATCSVIVSQNVVATPGTNFNHGTNVSAIAVGVAPASKIAMLNVFDGTGSASSNDIITAINWSIANQATYNIVAINMSLGGSTKFTSACTNDWSATPIRLANNSGSGISVVVASGNAAYTNGLSSPACAPGAISVGAVYDSNIGGVTWGSPPICTDTTTAADKVTCFSNSANYLTMLAPGAMITAGGITEAGTSQASPHVAGAVAVLRSTFPAETLAQTQTRLTGTGSLVTDTRNGIVKPRLNLLEAARPANNTFTNRSSINGQSGSVSGITLLSTKETGEPSHAGNAGGASIWWKWVAPASGQVSLDTNGSNYDTLLAVYTGTSVNALTAVAANDNAATGTLASGLLFQAKAGTEYEFAVDGVNGAAGSANLNWSLNAAASANLSVNISGPSSVMQGATADYLVSVSNAGPQAATNVSVNITLPPEATYVSGVPGCALSGTTLTCMVGSLANGATVTLGIQLLWTSLAASTGIVVSAGSDLPDPAAANNTIIFNVGQVASADGDTPTLPEWGMLLLASLLMGMNVRAGCRSR